MKKFKLKTFISKNYGCFVKKHPIFAFNLNTEGNTSTCIIDSKDRFELIEHEILPTVICENDFILNDIKASVGAHQRKMTMIYHDNLESYLLIDSSLFE